MKHIHHNENGFTLTEVIFVVLIVGTLSLISVPSLLNWKHFQDLKTKQLDLKTSLEVIKANAKRWGGSCTLDGATLESSCTSGTLQKRTSDSFSLSSSKESILISLLKGQGDENLFFVGSNFASLTFSPRGFVHVQPLTRAMPGNNASSDAVFVLGYQRSKNAFQRHSPELCVSIQHLTGHISLAQRQATKLNTSNQAVLGLPGLSCPTR